MTFWWKRGWKRTIELIIWKSSRNSCIVTCEIVKEENLFPNKSHTISYATTLRCDYFWNCYWNRTLIRSRGQTFDDRLRHCGSASGRVGLKISIFDFQSPVLIFNFLAELSISKIKYEARNLSWIMQNIPNFTQEYFIFCIFQYKMSSSLMKTIAIF